MCAATRAQAVLTSLFPQEAAVPKICFSTECDAQTTVWVHVSAPVKSTAAAAKVGGRRSDLYTDLEGGGAVPAFMFMFLVQMSSLWQQLVLEILNVHFDPT